MHRTPTLSRRTFTSGFTLIELIAVIVILGLIAAVAIPRFVDLSGAARESSVKAVAASLGSSSALNYAADILVRADPGASRLPAPVPIQSCEDGELSLLLSNGIPSGYRVETAPGAPGTVGVGERTLCRVVSETDDTIFAAFTLHGTDL